MNEWNTSLGKISSRLWVNFFLSFLRFLISRWWMSYSWCILIVFWWPINFLVLVGLFLILFKTVACLQIFFIISVMQNLHWRFDWNILWLYIWNPTMPRFLACYDFQILSFLFVGQYIFLKLQQNWWIFFLVTLIDSDDNIDADFDTVNMWTYFG